MWSESHQCVACLCLCVYVSAQEAAAAAVIAKAEAESAAAGAPRSFASALAVAVSRSRVPRGGTAVAEPGLSRGGSAAEGGIPGSGGAAPISVDTSAWGAGSRGGLAGGAGVDGPASRGSDGALAAAPVPVPAPVPRRRGNAPLPGALATVPEASTTAAAVVAGSETGESPRFESLIPDASADLRNITTTDTHFPALVPSHEVREVLEKRALDSDHAFFERKRVGNVVDVASAEEIVGREIEAFDDRTQRWRVGTIVDFRVRATRRGAGSRCMRVFARVARTV